MLYRGQITDRMGSDNHQTMLHTTWEAAHHAAEKLAKKLGRYQPERWSIDVIDVKEIHNL